MNIRFVVAYASMIQIKSEGFELAVSPYRDCTIQNWRRSFFLYGRELQKLGSGRREDLAVSSKMILTISTGMFVNIERFEISPILSSNMLVYT